MTTPSFWANGLGELNNAQQAWQSEENKARAQAEDALIRRLGIQQMDRQLAAQERINSQNDQTRRLLGLDSNSVAREGYGSQERSARYGVDARTGDVTARLGFDREQMKELARQADAAREAQIAQFGQTLKMQQDNLNATGGFDQRTRGELFLQDQEAEKENAAARAAAAAAQAQVGPIIKSIGYGGLNPLAMLPGNHLKSNYTEAWNSPTGDPEMIAQIMEKQKMIPGATDPVTGLLRFSRQIGGTNMVPNLRPTSGMNQRLGLTPSPAPAAPVNAAAIIAEAQRVIQGGANAAAVRARAKQLYGIDIP